MKIKTIGPIGLMGPMIEDRRRMAEDRGQMRMIGPDRRMRHIFDNIDDLENREVRMKISKHNDQIYNLAVCDEGKKVKLFLQFDIDGDGDPDVVVSFLPKKLGGDIEGDIIEKLRRFFDVFGFPKVLIVLSSLLVNKVRWAEGFPEITRIDIMPPVKTNEVEPVETWYFSMNAVHKTLFLVLRNSKKVFSKRKIELPVESVVQSVRYFLQNAFAENANLEKKELPGKIINETVERFSFYDNKNDFREMCFCDNIDESSKSNMYHFKKIEFEIIPVDGKEHLLIKGKSHGK